MLLLTTPPLSPPSRAATPRSPHRGRQVRSLRSDEKCETRDPELPPENKRTLDNTFIHAIIIRYDPTPDGARNIYQLFERLNTGGTNLYPQEIRVALYMGDLV